MNNSGFELLPSEEYGQEDNPKIHDPELAEQFARVIGATTLEDFKEDSPFGLDAMVVRQAPLKPGSGTEIRNSINWTDDSYYDINGNYVLQQKDDGGVKQD